jgi:rare lipoprotein A
MADGGWRMADGKTRFRRSRESFRHSPFAIRHCAAAALVAALAGCGSAPPRDAPVEGQAPAAKAPPARGGGYYHDDGPGANPPANLDGIPDAVPRVEPIRAATSRPYTVMGRSYTPMTSLQPYNARGIATWYGRRYHGKPTSSGEIYDMYAMTAAHTTLPIPSYARVTHLASGRSVVVRINDRGPFVEGRIIDLSYTAAHKLGVLAGGSAMVEVETILPGAAPPPPPVVAAVRPEPEPVVAASPPAPAAPAPAPAQPPIPVTADAGRYYLQLGAFGSRENAENFLARLQARLGTADNLHIHARDQLYRVHAGPYASQDDARSAADRLAGALGVKAIVLTR